MYKRETYITRFLQEMPEGKVVQEKGFSSIPIFMEVNRELFDPDMYDVIMSQVKMFSNLEEGSVKCLVNVSLGDDKNLSNRCKERGDEISETYLSDVANAYRTQKELFDYVINGFADNSLADLIALIGRLG